VPDAELGKRRKVSEAITIEIWQFSEYIGRRLRVLRGEGFVAARWGDTDTISYKGEQHDEAKNAHTCPHSLSR